MFVFPAWNGVVIVACLINMEKTGSTPVCRIKKLSSSEIRRNIKRKYK